MLCVAVCCCVHLSACCCAPIQTYYSKLVLNHTFFNAFKKCLCYSGLPSSSYDLVSICLVCHELPQVRVLLSLIGSINSDDLFISVQNPSRHKPINPITQACLLMCVHLVNYQPQAASKAIFSEAHRLLRPGVCLLSYPSFQHSCLLAACDACVPVCPSSSCSTCSHAFPSLSFCRRLPIDHGGECVGC